MYCLRCGVRYPYQEASPECKKYFSRSAAKKDEFLEGMVQRAKKLFDRYGISIDELVAMGPLNSPASRRTSSELSSSEAAECEIVATDSIAKCSEMEEAKDSNQVGSSPKHELANSSEEFVEKSESPVIHKSECPNERDALEDVACDGNTSDVAGNVRAFSVSSQSRGTEDEPTDDTKHCVFTADANDKQMSDGNIFEIPLSQPENEDEKEPARSSENPKVKTKSRTFSVRNFFTDDSKNKKSVATKKPPNRKR